MTTPLPYRLCKLCLPTVTPSTATTVNDRSTSVNATDTAERVMSERCTRCRLLKYVQVTPTCWLWTGTFYTQFGQPTYGQFWLDGKRTGAHRASYIIHNGAISDGLDVLHSCDVKACVNPDHLRLGTHQENIAEAYAKQPPGKYGGENHPRARLDWTSVRAIRAAAASGVSQASLADLYAVTPTHVHNIVNRKRWIEPAVPYPAVA